MDATQTIDTFELTKLGLSVSGQTSITQFVRLTSDLPEQNDSVVVWSVQGEKNLAGQCFLRVRIKAIPELECQRCLASFQWQVDTDNRLQVVNTEAALESEDAQNDESEQAIERIVGAKRFDVLSLIEDEIILSLPYVPKHAVCPAGHQYSAPQDEPETDEVRPSPFAVLGQLKKD